MAAKEWFEKDYYQILGVKKDASAAEIKKAFRKIARENHPDQHPGDKKREAKFKEASEAHSVLGDESKRKEYDEVRAAGPFMGGFGTGQSGFSAGFGNFPGGIRFDVGEAGNFGSLGDIFGGLGGFGRARVRKGSDVEGETKISFKDSLTGTTVNLAIAGQDNCPHCHGSGVLASGAENVGEVCYSCGGSGMVRSQRKVQARIPAGVADGQKIRLKGRGNPGSNGGAAGDLYLKVKVAEDPVFAREGKNIRIKVPVTFPEAVFGTTVEVPKPLGGSVRLKVPQYCSNGQSLRVKEAGVPNKNGTAGDLLVTIQVQVPKSLTEDAEKALSEYAKLAQEVNPREGLKDG